MNNKEAFETVASRKYPWLTFAKANDGSYLSTHIIDLYKGFCLSSQAQQSSGNTAQLAAESFEHWKSTLDHRFFDEPSPITVPFNAGFELGYQAALSADQENHIPEVGKMVQQTAQEPVKEVTE